MLGEGYQLLNAISTVAIVMRREVAESLAVESGEEWIGVYLWGDGEGYGRGAEALDVLVCSTPRYWRLHVCDGHYCSC